LFVGVGGGKELYRAKRCSNQKNKAKRTGDIVEKPTFIKQQGHLLEQLHTGIMPQSQ